MFTIHTDILPLILIHQGMKIHFWIKRKIERLMKQHFKYWNHNQPGALYIAKGGWPFSPGPKTPFLCTYSRGRKCRAPSRDRHWSSFLYDSSLLKSCPEVPISFKALAVFSHLSGFVPKITSWGSCLFLNLRVTSTFFLREDYMGKPSMKLSEVSLKKDIKDLIMYSIPIGIVVWYLFNYTGPEPRKPSKTTPTQAEAEKK